MKILQKISFVLILMVTGINCSLTNSNKLEKAIEKHEEKKRIELQQIKKVADDFLNSKIFDEQTLKRIRFDTIYRNSSNLVIYNIDEQNEILQNNMILIFVNNELKIDSLNTKLVEKEIKSYTENPIENKLLLSRRDLMRIAKQNEFEEGIKSWKISLSISGNSFENIIWCVSNTLNESNSGTYKASGKSMCINIFNGKIEFSMWKIIS